MQLIKRLLAATLTTAVAFGAAAQDNFPSKPLRIVVAYAAGGGTDNLARQLALRLESKLKQPVIVENRQGGAAVPAANAIITAPADGHSMALFDLSTVTMNQHLFKKPPYDPDRAFKPVGKIADIPHVLLVPTSSPVNTLQDFVAAVKANKLKVFGSPGSLTGSFLLFEEFLSRAGLQMEHTGYRGSAPAVTDVIGGQLPAAFIDINSAIQHIKAGKVKAVAVATAERSSLLPNVPTFIESGYPGYVGITWYGMFVHADTPAPIIKKLGDAMREVASAPDMTTWFQGQSLAPSLEGPEAFARIIQADSAKFGRIIKQKGLSLD